MDRDGVDATVLFSNFALFATYTDNHEVALAYAKVYNDWVAETYLPHSDRMCPLASIPTTDIGDAVKEAERCVRLGLRGLFLPEHPQRFLTTRTSMSRCGPARRRTACRSSSTSRRAGRTPRRVTRSPGTRSRASSPRWRWARTGS